MSGVIEFSRGNAPDPLAYTPARAALLDRLDMLISQAGFPWDRARPVGAELVTSLASLQTVVSVTGRGLVKIGIQSTDSTATREARVVITIDGVVVSDFADASLAISGAMMGYGSGAVGGIGNYSPVSQSHVYEIPYVGFRSSLLVQASTTSGANVRCVAEVITV